MKRLFLVLGVAFGCAPGCTAHAPVVSPKNDVFVLRYLEMDPQAVVADGVHPLIAELQVGLLELFDDNDDRRLLSINPQRTAGARTPPLARRLVDHIPTVFVPTNSEPTDIDSEEFGEGGGAEEAIGAAPSRPISEDGSAEVERYLEAYRSALALGVERAKLVEPALRLFETLVLRARDDAHRRW